MVQDYGRAQIGEDLIEQVRFKELGGQRDALPVRAHECAADEFFRWRCQRGPDFLSKPWVAPPIDPAQPFSNAISSLTIGLSKLLAPKRIRVNAVAPGPVWTPIQPIAKEPEELEKLGRTRRSVGQGSPPS